MPIGRRIALSDVAPAAELFRAEVHGLVRVTAVAFVGPCSGGFSRHGRLPFLRIVMGELMEGSFFLEVDVGEYATLLHRMAFASKADAVAQLEKIEPLLGHGKFRNDPEQNRHRISGPDGELIVVLEHVRSVRVIDRGAYDELAKYSTSRERDLNNDMAERIAKAVAETMAPLLMGAASTLKPPERQ